MFGSEPIDPEADDSDSHENLSHSHDFRIDKIQHL
jgi:hypothetical protein